MLSTDGTGWCVRRSKQEAPAVPIGNVSTRSAAEKRRSAATRVGSPAAASPESALATYAETAAGATMPRRDASFTKSPEKDAAGASSPGTAATAPNEGKRAAEWEHPATRATRSRAAAGEVEIVPPLPEAALAAAERRTNRREALAAAAAFAAAASGEEEAEPRPRAQHSLGPAARAAVISEEGGGTPAEKPGQSTAIAMMVGNRPTAFKVC